jgi:hypothetical protein
MVRTQDFIAIGHGIHQVSQCEMGRTAFNNALTDLADAIVDVCSDDPQFDRAKFMKACALPLEREGGEPS